MCERKRKVKEAMRYCSKVPLLKPLLSLVGKNVGSGGYCEEAERKSHSCLTHHQTTTPQEQKMTLTLPQKEEP